MYSRLVINSKCLHNTIVMLYGAVILSDFKVVVLCCGGIVGSKNIVL